MLEPPNTCESAYQQLPAANYETSEQFLVMGGMPKWMLLVAAAAILILSFVVVEKSEGFLGKNRGGQGAWKFNLLKSPFVYRVVKHRAFQSIAQTVMVIIFVGILYAGLAGNRISNIAPVIVWTIWWGGLVFVVALFGPLFCFACPWDGLANLLTRLKSSVLFRWMEPLSLHMKVPRRFRNLYPAIALFVFLTWAELGMGVTSDPRVTAYMGIGMAVMAIAGAMLFEKKAFCRHLCPVGRISGIYANFSPVEVRAKDPKICSNCKTQECFHGSANLPNGLVQLGHKGIAGAGYACPTGISLRALDQSTNCTMCTECVKSCTKGNVALNLRPFGFDLARMKRYRLDEAWLCVALLSLTLFHGFSMTTLWENHYPGEPSLLKWMAIELRTPRVLSFSVAMLAACALPIWLYWESCKWGAIHSRDPSVNAGKLFRAYSFSLLPIALFYHLAHNVMHLLMEAGSVLPMLSDPLGQGKDYFGTANIQVGHLAEEQTVWWIQIALILTGHLFGIIVAHRISRKLYRTAKAASRSLVPMLGVMVLVSIAGLWMMILDMNMKIGRM